MPHHEIFTTDNLAVITGAADGIGLAAARCFAGFGMHVLMADIDRTRLEAAARAITARPGQRIETQVIDVAQFATVAALKARAYADFGRVDVLMNNAGTSEKTGAWSALEQWQHLLNVNLWGIIHGVQAFTQAMIDQGTPALIINTGSKQGITNPPGNPAYNVSKAGVKAATEALQHELRNTPNCKVSAHLLVPGYTYTGLTRRHVQTQPAAAWLPEQVVDHMLKAIARGSFYIICPDHEVPAKEDARRILWAARDLIDDRPALSRWHAEYQEAFAQFET